jgi:hypothetical protein
MKASRRFVAAHIGAIVILAYFALWYYNKGAWNGLNTLVTSFVVDIYKGLGSALEFGVKISKSLKEILWK